MNTITIILLILGVVAGFYFGQKRNGTIFVKKEFKEGAKASILQYIKDKGKITNDEVEDIIGVSNRSATRYLDELEKENMIKQVGETGRGVYYTLK